MKKITDSIFYSVSMMMLLWGIGLHLLLLVVWSLLNQLMKGLGFLCASFVMAFLGLASVISPEWADEKLVRLQEWSDSDEEE